MAATAITNGHAGAHAAPHDDSRYRLKANRLGLWLFIASESFLFAAFISSRYITDLTHRPEDLNQSLALFLTIVLLVSSISAYLGETAIAHGRRGASVAWLTLTVVLGLSFMIGVGFEFAEAVDKFPVNTVFGSNFFMLIGLHSFHVLTGAAALAIAANLVRKGHFDENSHWGVEACVKYWHFVDLAWVVIYPTLYLVGRH
mgnify:CR=1 FL=1